MSHTHFGFAANYKSNGQKRLTKHVAEIPDASMASWQFNRYYEALTP